MGGPYYIHPRGVRASGGLTRGLPSFITSTQQGEEEEEELQEEEGGEGPASKEEEDWGGEGPVSQEAVKQNGRCCGGTTAATSAGLQGQSGLKKGSVWPPFPPSPPPPPPQPWPQPFCSISS